MYCEYIIKKMLCDNSVDTKYTELNRDKYCKFVHRLTAFNF